MGERFTTSEDTAMEALSKVHSQLRLDLIPVNSDAHYRKIELSGDPEPIVVQESLMERLIEAGVPPRRAFDIVAGQKHISRAGVKSGEDWEKEIRKSINYLFRSLTGRWIPESVYELE